MPGRVMPDPVDVGVDWLQAQTRVTDLVGKRISYRLGKLYPAIRLTDLGAIEAAAEEATHRLQVECWADDYETASSIARAVMSVLSDAAGQWSTGYCMGAGWLGGPFSSPDIDSERHRHQLDVALVIAPTPTP